MCQLVDLPRPAYLRLTRDPSPVIFDESYDLKIGKGIFLREGRDVAIISTGVQTTRCLEACDTLESQGIHPLLLHLPTLKPIDQGAIIRAARETGRVVTAEDHSVIGGLGGAVAEILGECYPTPVKRVGIRDVFGESAPNEPLLEKYGLTSSHVVAAVKEQISKSYNTLYE